MCYKCKNGIREPELNMGDEECDDGNDAHDTGCLSDCTIDPLWECTEDDVSKLSTCNLKCGNGHYDDGE